jgi:hypothetical protein
MLQALLHTENAMSLQVAQDKKMLKKPAAKGGKPKCKNGKAKVRALQA